MKKWIMGTIAIALILVLPAWYYLRDAKGVSIIEQIQLDGERIEKIEAYYIDEYASTSYLAIDKIQPWVTFLNSLEISYEKDGYSTSTRMPTTITIYYTNGRHDVIDYGYSDLYYNGEFYHIGKKYRDYPGDEYRDYISKNQRILDKLTGFLHLSNSM